MIDEISFTNVPVEPSTTAETTLKKVDQSISLQVDADGNGTVDKVIIPSVTQCASNVSSQVTITRGGFRKNSANGRYV